MENKIGIKETTEVIEFMSSSLKSLAAAKKADGKVDLWDWASIAISNAPEAYDAVLGLDRIDDEIKDLSREELEILGKKLLEMAKEVKSLMSKE